MSPLEVVKLVIHCPQCGEPMRQAIRRVSGADFLCEVCNNGTWWHITMLSEEPRDLPDRDVKDLVLPACFFCRQKWGKCRCQWHADDGFEWEGFKISEPNVDETGRFYVNPEDYYGDAYKKWAATI